MDNVGLVVEDLAAAGRRGQKIMRALVPLRRLIPTFLRTFSTPGSLLLKSRPCSVPFFIARVPQRLLRSAREATPEPPFSPSRVDPCHHQFRQEQRNPPGGIPGRRSNATADARAPLGAGLCDRSAGAGGGRRPSGNGGADRGDGEPG